MNFLTSLPVVPCPVEETNEKRIHRNKKVVDNAQEWMSKKCQKMGGT